MDSTYQVGHTVLPASRIGLGCSRLGSVLGASMEDSELLLKVAFDHGIRFFDTSNIYAQGDSEHIIGKALSGLQDVVICTKVGKYIPLKTRVMLPFKSLIRQVVGRNTKLREGVRSSRARGMPTNWEPGHLQESVEGSLRRLKRDQVQMVMLHGPTEEIVRRGDAVEALAKLKSAGKIGVIGVSVEDPETAMAALSDPRVEALQIPLHPGSTGYRGVLKAARENGVAVVAREVLGGPNLSKVLQGNAVSARLQQTARLEGVSVVLLGTTKVKHLEEALAPFRVSVR